MSNPNENGQEPRGLDRWCNEEIALEMGPQHSVPPQPITGKRLESLKAERALRARLDPQYRALLEKLGIHLTPEELQEPSAGP
jgi:hypothetical protein